MAAAGGISPEEFRELLERGLIRPVEELEAEDAFSELESDEGGFADPADVLPEGGVESGSRAGDPSVGDPALSPLPVEPRPLSEFSENPFLVFGSRIRLNPNRTITKPYPLRAGTGQKMLQLILEYGNFPIYTATEGGPPPTANDVKIELLPDHDVEIYQDLRDPTFPKVEPVPLSDWLVVTTGEDLLHEIESFINLFAAGVPQIEIEAKIVEITFTDTLDYGVRQAVDGAGNPIPTFQSDSGFFNSLNLGFPNLSGASEGLLALGGIQDGLAFNAVLEFLASRQNVSIISQPKIAVREGGRADIVNLEKIPFVKITTLNPSGGFNATIDYIDVGVQLYVVPRVVGTDTVALNIDVEASQQTGTVTTVVGSTALNSQEVETPIVSTRSAKTIVYLEPGQAVILGGLISERNVEREDKIPFLGDIPLLGLLFKSKFVQKEQTNVLFFIRPRILQGSDLNRDF